ncbi:NETI motif-containing protein [Bacillus sp. V59.32b]|uniref:NETI motif-containing protein n=1 Tax=Bacillus sp. V59.32b TaxID=1758642 RepID=UPI000E3EA189|nr:NETI motif-containing protein [Bacillus sp. V59.32b]RFU60594.1 NETI motif-containing protein [Bacillus sp. V59.32b]
MTKKKKEIFEVEDGETIDACLERIKAAGYVPVKRTEKPIFQEIVIDGKVQYEPIKRKMMFEAKLLE